LQPISRPEPGIIHIAQETNRNDQGFHVRAEQLLRPGKPVVAPIREPIEYYIEAFLDEEAVEPREIGMLCRFFPWRR
jgi:hypothetical protein